MFDFVGRHKKLIQGVLFLLFIPFAFLWVGDYIRDRGTGEAVARVGDYRITQQEFQRALRDRQQALQRAVQGGLPPDVLDSPELRRATLDELIERRLLLDRALRAGMTVSEAQLESVIRGIALFQDETNRFSFSRYREALRSEGMTPVAFETRLRHDLILQQLSAGYGATAFAPRTVVESLVRLLEQQREVSYSTIRAAQFAGRVKLEPEAPRKYYDSNPDEFRVPEQVRVEYVVLSADELAKDIRIAPEEARKAYEARRGELGVEEERRAGHILIAVAEDAGPEAKARARARAEELRRELAKQPQRFAELAKKHSQDPGSAANGGDLGWIRRGSMRDLPEFESALFALKAGEISEPVVSRHGVHLIRATEIRPARVKSFEEARTEIEEALKKEHASRRFAELADRFANLVYEHSESLKPAAELIGSAPRTSGWLTRSGGGDPLLGHPRLLEAIFSGEALKERRNTEAIEVARNVLVSARVVEHKPPAMRPFEEVEGAIRERLVRREAARLAAEEGLKRLAALREGATLPELSWSAPQLVRRDDHKGLPERVVREAFRAPADSLPAYSGFGAPGEDYTLVRVTRVLEPASVPEARRSRYEQALRRVLAQEAMSAYVASLKGKTEISVNRSLLETK